MSDQGPTVDIFGQDGTPHALTPEQADQYYRISDFQARQNFLKTTGVKASLAAGGSNLVPGGALPLAAGPLLDSSPWTGAQATAALGIPSVAHNLPLSNVSGVDSKAAYQQVPQAGGYLNFSQLRQLALQAGFQGDKANLMAGIAMAESYGKVDAVNPKDPGGSYGVTQINAGAHGDIAKSAKGDALQAMKLAFQVSNGGQTFSPWTTYRTGAYKQFMGGPSADVNLVAGGAIPKATGVPLAAPGGAPQTPPAGTLAQGTGGPSAATSGGPDMAKIADAVSKAGATTSPWQKLMMISMIQQLSSQGTHQFTPIDYDPWKALPAAQAPSYRLIVGSKGEPIGYV